jgi:methylenetetrahydrofolate reductase (NADPH)
VTLSEILTARSPCFSFEFFPPKDDPGVDQLLATIAELRPFQPGFVSVTYGAGGSSRRLTVELVKRIKAETGIETVAHLTCVGSSRREIETVLEDLVAGGIENVLALRGDPPRGETTFTPVEGGFAHANDLVAFIKARYPLSIAAACYPEKHPEAPTMEEDLAHLREKVDAGTELLVTQLFFDNADYFRFVERARATGIEVPIVPGLMPITNLSQIKRFTATCGATIPADLLARLEATGGDRDQVVEIGVAHATAQARSLLAGGAPGIHFFTLNRSNATRRVLEAIRTG